MNTASIPGRPGPRRRRRGLFVLLAAGLVLLGAAAVFAVLAVNSKAALTLDQSALASVRMPLGGGRVERFAVVAGREQKILPVRLAGGQLWPLHALTPGERVYVDVLIRRPGWLSWLTGSTQRVRLNLVAPAASLRSPYVTVRRGGQLALSFKRPVRLVEYRSAGRIVRRVLRDPTSAVEIRPPAAAGSLLVAGAPRAWERPRFSLLTWFPPGSSATAVASPAPGRTIQADTPITLTFSKPVARALGSHLPPVSPDTAGTWHELNSHTITFKPAGFGYGLGASVSIPLPAGIRLVGATGDPVARWKVPGGSTLRLQQILARLGYLPLTFASASPAPTTLAGELRDAFHPPSGNFNWRYSDTPGSLRSLWAPGGAGVMTRGAVMAFENDNELTPDGVAGPAVWKALLEADMKDATSGFGYTFVSVSEGSPESERTWHDGRVVVSGLVNTGVSAAPTATGVYPVFEHLPVTTMTGINPDGSHYKDPGIPWVSYFNGGDALHGFIRASYGFPQSDGCVEMPYSEAHAVYPYTPIGTLVDVS